MSITHILAALVAVLTLGFAGQAEARAVPQKSGYEDVAVEDVLVKAEAGDRQAQLEMGRRFYYRPELKSDAMALKWFEKAAEQGEANAEYETATMYILGEGTKADTQKALYWYRRAAADGYIEAYYDIGMIYLNGEGVPADYAEAAKWFQLAAEQGERRGQYFLGLMYRDGRGVPQDYALAMKWLRESVKNRLAIAAVAIEGLYRNGQGVPKDPVAAQTWKIVAVCLTAIERRETSTIAVKDAPDLTAQQNADAAQAAFALLEEFGILKAAPAAKE